jgi:phage shock protein E
MNIRWLALVLLGSALACGAPRADEPAAVQTIPAATVAAQAGTAGAPLVLLDVRTREEFAAGHVPGARNIPVQELASRLSEIADLRDKPLVVYCRSGHRAGIALELLRANGYTQLAHLEGDMIGWQAAGREVETSKPAGGAVDKGN